METASTTSTTKPETINIIIIMFLHIHHLYLLVHHEDYNYHKSNTTSLTTQSSTTALHVLTTPESIIEQASTVNLLDDLIDESVRTSARRPIMMQFDPSSGWIWRRWAGTVFAETWTSCVRNMVYAMIYYFIQSSYPNINSNLKGFGTLWAQLLSISTFTLTFFVNTSYGLWRRCMELSRRLQGRLHDINMNLASHAARKVPSNPNEKSTYTAASRQILELMSRYVRLFNLLTYASFTRSHRPILTPRGMRRLVERGLMTATEREVLVDAAIPATQRHSVVLMWMIRLFVEGRDSGHIQGGAGFEQETMNKFHIIRAQYGGIGDELQGRMPLAYAHIVQVLVDLILWMFPIMAFSTGMSPLLVVVGTGLLTISYQGLFDLAKQFLDPYDNENYGRGEDPLCVDTLIAETNAGSVRWLYGFEELPYSAQRVNDGEMYDYLLPVRGYSVEELAQMEEERIEREKQLEEQRKREEEEAAERLRKEAEEAAAAAQELEEVIDGVEATDNITEAEEEFDLEMANKTKSLEVVQSKSKSKSIRKKGNKTATVAIEEPSSALKKVKENQNKTNISTESSDKSENKTVVVGESVIDEVRTIHKVTTLATGKPVANFKATQQTAAKEVVEKPVPSDIQTTNYLATLSKGKKTLPKIPVETVNLVPQLIDYEQFDDVPWVFDETGPDGQEMRLSQQLADEEWTEPAGDVETKTMTWDEYQERVKEIKENAENELRETVEILSASPGADGDEKLYTVTERKKKKGPSYDQTRMDGISQLWGLPPEDPSELREVEQQEKLEDIEFDSISQLWGGASLSGSGSSSSSTKKRKQEDAEVAGLESFAGISELWGNSLDDFQEEDDSEKSSDRAPTANSREGGDNDSGGTDDDIGGSFGGIPRYKEKDKDGKEYRLSQMLADEEWSVEIEPEESSAMTLEDYNKAVEEILTQAEEEMRETEAILLSKPGTDPVGWDYDEEKLAPMSDGTEDENGEEIEQKEAAPTDDDLAILEMDSEDEEDLDEKNSKDGTPIDSDDPPETVTNGVSEVIGSNDEDSANDPISSETDEEAREAEAILMSKPGLDPVGWDYEEDQLAPMENITKVEEADGEAHDSEGESNSPVNGNDKNDTSGIKSKGDVNEDISPEEEKQENDFVKGSDIIQPITLEDGDDSQDDDSDSNN